MFTHNGCCGTAGHLLSRQPRVVVLIWTDSPVRGGCCSTRAPPRALLHHSRPARARRHYVRARASALCACARIGTTCARAEEQGTARVAPRTVARPTPASPQCRVSSPLPMERARRHTHGPRARYTGIDRRHVGRVEKAQGADTVGTQGRGGGLERGRTPGPYRGATCPGHTCFRMADGSTARTRHSPRAGY